MDLDQILYLRFLRMKQEFPHLKHDGTEPGLPREYGTRTLLKDMEQRWGRRRAEFEFYRPMEEK